MNNKTNFIDNCIFLVNKSDLLKINKDQIINIIINYFGVKNITK